MAAEKGLRLIRSEPVGDDRAGIGAIKSAKRVLEVLELFAERQEALGVGDVVAALGYPQSSTSTLLRSLVQLHYLHYDAAARKFMPTMRVALLGSWIHDRLFTSTSLNTLMEGLYKATGYTVLLGMQNDIYLQYIHLIPGVIGEWYIKPGSLRPLCRAAIGKVLLARKPDVEVLGLLRRINAEETNPDNRVRPNDLFEDLNQIRRDGYACTEGAVIPTNGVVAIELPTPPSQPPMAIGIGAANSRIRAERDRLLSLLREAVHPYVQSRPPPSL